VAPFYSQAKRVAWAYLLRAAAGAAAAVNIAELTVTLVNGSKIMLFGADNPDALRGLYFDGVVIDEPAQMRGRVFSEIIRPALADRIGWCLFIGTPMGKNEFWKLREQARTDPAWFYMELKASVSGLLPQSEIDDMARVMDEDELAQELECDFSAAIKGSFYGKFINDARAQGRIRRVAHDAALPVHTVWDLGYTDTTAIWFWQCLGPEIRYIRALERAGLELADYVDILRSFTQYTYGDVWLPHDARARSLQTGRSTIEILHRSHNVKSRLVPELSVQQGIQAARFVLSSPTTYIDADDCEEGIEALSQYQREWDDERHCFKEQPKHDHSSNYADAFRYSAIIAHKGARVGANRITPPPAPVLRNGRIIGRDDSRYNPKLPFGGNVTLNELFAAHAQRGRQRI